MKITEDLCKYTAEQAISEKEVSKERAEAKSKQLVGKHSEVYAKA